MLRRLHACVSHGKWCLSLSMLLFTLVQTCDTDLDEEVSKVEELALFFVWTGTAGDENAQFYVCCEQSVLIESKTVTLI